MDFFGTSYRINRSINTLMAAANATTPEAVQAIKMLQGCRTTAIPKILDACAKTRPSEPLMKLLLMCVEDETVPLFRKGLSSTNPRIVTTIVEALTKSTSYDPHLLLPFLADPGIAKAAIKQLLESHKQALNPTVLLRYLETVAPQDRPIVASLVAQTASATTVSALIYRLESEEEEVRLTCAQTLMRFPTEAVGAAIYRLLTDVSPRLRVTALEGLGRLPLPLNLRPICQRLTDDHDGVRREAKRLLVQCQDPQLLTHLFDMLEDKSCQVQAEVADILGTVRDARAIQDAVAVRPDAAATCAVLLRLLSAPHTRIRRAALVGLTSVKSTFDITAVSPFLWDSDSQTRRLTVAILTHYKVPQTLEALERAFKDESATVRQEALAILNVIADPYILQEVLRPFQTEDEAIAARAITLLGSRGEAPVIQAALQFVADQDAYLRHAVHEILTRTDDPTVVPYLTEMLTKPDAWGRQCAAEALGMLGEKGRDAVPALLEMAQTGETEGLLALDALTKMGDPRAIPLCLTHMQHGSPALQHKALQALAVLTDAENFDAVLYPMLAIRDTMPSERKAPFNQTAVTLVRRFPGRVASDKLLPPTMVETQVLTQVMTQVMPMEASSAVLVAETPQEVVIEMPAAVVLPSQGDVSASPIGPAATPTGPTAPQPPQEPHDTEALDPTASLPGTMLGGRYRVIQRIGEGGFGTVMLVNDTVVNEELILKFLHPRFAADQRMMQRFIHELLYARRITHEHVIRIHDFLQIENTYAIAMEYFAGHNLSTEVEQKRFLQDIQGALRILVSICRGMQRAHQIGILHRDMKPTNILINDEGVVKIVDFGLAAAMTDDATQLTRVGEMLGTPLYMAPEQANNSKLDARTDIYSLGVMMYEMLTGQPPYGGDRALAILFQHVAGNPTPPRAINAQIPPEVEAVILKAMAVDPEQRFQSMEEFEKRLLALYHA